MGKGDKKTKKGKIFKGSYGVVRPRKSATSTITTAKESIPKKETKAKKETKDKKKTTTKKKKTAKK